MNNILDNLFHKEKLGIGNKATFIKNVRETHPDIKVKNFSLLRVSRDHLPCGAVVMQSVASTAPYLPPAGQLRLIPIYYAP